MQPLRREVEMPRHAAGLWAPVLALISATMATLVVGVAVTAKPLAPQDPIKQQPPPAAATVERVIAPTPEVHPICGQKVYRATPDGAELYEECAQQRGRGAASGGSADGKIIRR
jgi:hypothetical protein